MFGTISMSLGTHLNCGSLVWRKEGELEVPNEKIGNGNDRNWNDWAVKRGELCDAITRQ
jgi:hypothetical protein